MGHPLGEVRHGDGADLEDGEAELVSTWVQLSERGQAPGHAADDAADGAGGAADGASLKRRKLSERGQARGRAADDAADGAGGGWNMDSGVGGAVYQPNCQWRDALGAGVRLDRGGHVIEREPVCYACGALLTVAASRGGRLAPPLLMMVTLLTSFWLRFAKETS